MNKLGEKLRRQRLEKGVELAQIAAETRISTRYLEALENGNTKVLPGSLFAKSFAKQFAQQIGLEESEMEAELNEAFPSEDNIPALGAPAAKDGFIRVDPMPYAGASGSQSRQLYRSAMALLIVVAACSGVYVGWQRWFAGGSAPELAAEYQPPPSIPMSQPAPPAAAPAVEPAAQVPASDSADQPPAGDTPKAAIELNMPQSTQGMAVRVVASERTWVSITVNGRSVFSGVLQPNEERTLGGVERAKMVIGNAGGVEVLTDGKSIGPIGPTGQVRVVLLTPEGPQILRTETPRSQEAQPKEGRS
jgi:cytoskeleton protein RodZ